MSDTFTRAEERVKDVVIELKNGVYAPMQMNMHIG